MMNIYFVDYLYANHISSLDNCNSSYYISHIQSIYIYRLGCTRDGNCENYNNIEMLFTKQRYYTPYNVLCAL